MRMDHAGTMFTMILDKGRYNVGLPPENYLILTAGVVLGTAGEKFDHPNVAARVPKIFELKHYHPVRGKWWSNMGGIDLLFVIPKHRIELIEEPGYSYPKIRIGDQTYSMNVSGGTFPQGEWTDTVYQGAHIGIKHTLKSLRNLANNALSPVECREMGISFPVQKQGREETFLDLVAKNAVQKILKPGLKIMLREGSYVENEGNRGPFAIEEGWSFNKKCRKFIVTTEGSYPLRVRVSYKHIGWKDTAVLNGIELTSPETINRIGEVLEKKD